MSPILCYVVAVELLTLAAVLQLRRNPQRRRKWKFRYGLRWALMPAMAPLFGLGYLAGHLWLALRTGFEGGNEL